MWAKHVARMYDERFADKHTAKKTSERLEEVAMKIL